MRHLLPPLLFHLSLFLTALSPTVGCRVFAQPVKCAPSKFRSLPCHHLLPPLLFHPSYFLTTLQWVGMFLHSLSRVLPWAQPKHIARSMWCLANLRVRPPDPWLLRLLQQTEVQVSVYILISILLYANRS